MNELGVLARELNDLRVLRRYATGSGHKIFTFDHHLCHAAGAFFPSPFDRALIVTMDEDGDGNSGMLGVGEGNRIRVLRTIAFRIRWLGCYSQMTDLVGFRPHREEHKTQWLSLEGEPTYKDAVPEDAAGARRSNTPVWITAFSTAALPSNFRFQRNSIATLGLPADPQTA